MEKSEASAVVHLGDTHTPDAGGGRLGGNLPAPGELIIGEQFAGGKPGGGLAGGGVEVRGEVHSLAVSH